MHRPMLSSNPVQTCSWKMAEDWCVFKTLVTRSAVGSTNFAGCPAEGRGVQSPINACVLWHRSGGWQSSIMSCSFATVPVKQGCPSYGPLANCGLCSIFIWPAANSKNVMKYGPHMRLTLDYIVLLSFNTR